MSRTAGSEADGGSARKIERDEDSGPLKIAPRVEPQQTNAAPAAQNVSVEHIGALTADELEEVTSISDPAARGLSSGAFDKGGVDWSVLRKPVSLPPPLPQRAIAEEPPRPALKAFYDRLPQPSERAEIQIEDLSLDFTNPFVGSSLLPPAPKKRPWLKPVLFTAAAGLFIGAGYVGALLNTPGSQPTAAEVRAAEPGSQLTAAAPEAAAVPLAQHVVAPAAEPPAQAEPSVPVVAQPVAVAAQPLAALPQPKTPAQLQVPAPAAPTAAPRPRATRPVPVAAVAAPTPELAKPAPATPSVSASPTPPAAGATLSRDQVQIGLESTRTALQACAAGGHGRTMANVTISGAGRVTYASIEGAFAGTPQGSCMARALRAAQFPPFTSTQLRVRYPFAF